MDRKLLNKEFLNASEKGNLQKIKKLLENGANVNARNKWGDTALMRSALKGHKEVVEILIENGANINAKNGLMDTTMMYAAANGHVEIVQLLIDKGADVNAKNYWQYTAIALAALNKHEKVVKLLADSMEAGRRDDLAIFLRGRTNIEVTVKRLRERIRRIEKADKTKERI